MTKKITKLNRFTTLPILLDLLKRGKLTFLDPKSWEDKNDTEIILEYKKRANIKNLFAICFTHEDETIHHWKTYSNGSSGCVIEFDANSIFKIVKKIPEIKHSKVDYRHISEMDNLVDATMINKIPFTKRWPYRCENEYRFIYETNSNIDSFELPIPINCITKITLSQQMPQTIYETIKQHLRDLKQNPDGKISRSTLYENKKWINIFR
jgi:hypothetical protein